MEVGYPHSREEGARLAGGTVAWRLLGVALLVGVLAAGLGLRYAEPLSSPVIGAEDPWTHMVFTKEHVERGYWDDSFYLGTSLYPPGFHAWMGATWLLTGVNLYAFTRLFPPLLGALGVAGVFLLASRSTNVAGGFVAAALWATMPEAIFRTNLMFPTALDLAVLPFMLLALVETAKGHRAWAAALAAMGVAVALAHPWTLILFTAGAGVFLALNLPLRLAGAGGAGARARPWHQVVGDHVLAGVATLGLLAFAWRYDLSSDDQRLELLDNLSWAEAGPLLEPVRGAASALGAAGLAAMAVTVAVGAAAWVVARRQPEWWTRRRHLRPILGAAVGAAVALGAWLAVQPLLGDLPAFVNYQRMLGTPAIVAAFVGIAALFLRAAPGGLVGLGVAASLFPITAINFLDAWYIPHRTVVYMALGLALLGGHAAGALSEAAPRLVPRRKARVRKGVAVATVLALVVGTGGALAASPPETFEWYRLYDADDTATIRETVALLESQEGSRVVAGTWQSGLYFKALGEMDDVRWGPRFFQEAAFRDKILSEFESQGITGYLVVDEYVMENVQEDGWTVSFLENGGYERVLPESGAVQNDDVVIYRLPTGSGS